ncbi:hypothetical protein OIU77_030443, partial [Salix suchowensis]
MFSCNFQIKLKGIFFYRVQSLDCLAPQDWLLKIQENSHLPLRFALHLLCSNVLTVEIQSTPEKISYRKNFC